MRPIRILIIAGLLVWALSGIEVVQRVSSPTGPRAFVDLFAWLLFLGAFLFEAFWPRTVDFRLALIVQTVSALILVSSSGRSGTSGALLVMIAGQLPAVCSMRSSLIWVVAQTSLAFLPGLGPGRFLLVGVGALAYLAFQLFAVGAAGLAESERRAREELAEAKGRLEALQERLAETSREAERLRIARELHDSLGHHLTALGLDLELAKHLARGDALAPVERARSLASFLMAELRGAVTELRADSGGDLISSLEALARSEGRPRVHVEIGPGVGEVPSRVALALTRVAQEVVTNSTKHSKAATLKITLRASEDGWTFQGCDDGVGTDALRSGHGLSGMRERVEGIGGTLTIDPRPGLGFAVTATVPGAARA